MDQMPEGWSIRRLADWYVVASPSGDRFLVGNASRESRARGHLRWGAISLRDDSLIEAGSLQELVALLDRGGRGA